MLLGSAVFARAQAIPSPDAAPQAAVTKAPRTVARPAPELSIVFTAVTTRGKPAAALLPGDCIAEVQGRQLPLRKLTPLGKEPRTFALLLNTAGSQQTVFAAEQQAASAIADRLRPQDEAMLLAFDTDITLLSDFTAHRAALDAVIHSAPMNASVGHFTTGTLPPIGKVDGALLYDAVHLGIQRLKDEAGRRILVVIGNGVDQGSRTPLRQVIREAQRAQVTIDGLLVRDVTLDDMLEASGKGSMRQMTETTGGEMFPVDARGKGLKPAMAGIEQQLDAGWRGVLPEDAITPGKAEPLRLTCQQQGHALRVRAPKALVAADPVGAAR